MMIALHGLIFLLVSTISIVAVAGNPSNLRRVRQAQTTTSSLGRVDCYPERESIYYNFSQATCLARGCLYDSSSTDVPCYFQPNYGYILQGTDQTITNGIRLSLTLNQAVQSPFPEPIQNVNLDVTYYKNNIIRFKLYDANNSRYEVPIPLAAADSQISSPLYLFSHSSNTTNNNTFSFTIKRSDNQTVLFDTSMGGLVLNNQFLQIVSRLQSPHIYGFGENNHVTLKHNVSARTIWGIFPRDQATYSDVNTNQYGQFPFYLVMEQTTNVNQTPTGQMHGVLLLNSNAMDYSFGPDPSVTIRTIGGILDFFVFLGPTPEQVVQQYTWLVGRPIMPPYWSLGFMISRWGYMNLTNLQAVNQRNRNAGVPLDVQFSDIDYMDANKDFTVDPINYNGLKQFFAELQAAGLRTIIILDPGTYNDPTYYTPTVQGIQQNVYITWENGTQMLVPVWPGPLFLPDFLKNQTSTWWMQLIINFYKVNLTFDGLWIDMNEPAAFGTNDDAPWDWETIGNFTLKCPTSALDDPPYRTKAVYRYDYNGTRPARLSDHTVCMVGAQGNINSSTGKAMYRHYDVHSLYGWSETKPTIDAVRAVTGKRGLVLTRSTFLGSGQWGVHWLGDNGATWTQLKQSLVGIVEFNWFGIPMVGADICGFALVPTEEMCIRWQQVGAFYPFSRNHNSMGLPDQDPASWSPSATAIMITALRIRYTILPYYYTLFYKAHTQGSTVVRPLFHEFPMDVIAFDIYLQFLIGPYIMIVPVTDENTTQVNAYTPASLWYDYYTGALVSNQSQYVTLQAPLTTIPILLRGGAIIPTQVYANNTNASRSNPFGLIVVLDSNGYANGDLFYDDGETIDTIENDGYFYATYAFSTQNKQLNITVVKNNYTQISSLTCSSVSIYGLTTLPSIIMANGQQISATMRANTQIIDVAGLGLPMNASYSLTWSYQNETGTTSTQTSTTSSTIMSSTTTTTQTTTTTTTATTSQNGSAQLTCSENVLFCIFMFLLFSLLR